jgi:hypothetical protein
MLASFSRGTALVAEELFRSRPRVLSRALANLYNRSNAVGLRQLQSQASSLVEYLAGSAAPEDRRAPFRAFFKETTRRGDDERIFQRHFGYGYDRLLRDWREWVEARGIGAHSIPPPDLITAIRDRIVPAIRDHNLRVMDRVLAVRDLGRTGFPFGCDALIGLLLKNDRDLREEIIWALEDVSGLALGDDPEGWCTWWNSLPEAIRAADRDVSFDRSTRPITLSDDDIL